MVEISGKVYMIIGLAVAVTSLVINILTKTKSLSLFVFIGVIAFVYGLFTMLSQKKAGNNPQDKQLKGEHHKMHQHNKPSTNQVHTAQNQHVNPHNTIKNQSFVHNKMGCSRCGNTMNTYDNFCSNCGYRMR
jgi:DNA polymerase II large subunit